MIFKSIEFIRRNLNEYFGNVISTASGTGNLSPVRLGNIAFIEAIETTYEVEDDRLYLSLVNIQEEMTLKNRPAVIKNSLSDASEYRNPPLPLNLYLLVSAYYVSYSNALRMLSHTIAFFQANNRLSFIDNPVEDEDFTDNSEDYTFNETDRRKIDLSIELMSLTFEQINHLWGALGGKQVPFALYKIRLVEVELEQLQKGGGLIKEIQT